MGLTGEDHLRAGGLRPALAIGTLSTSPPGLPQAPATGTARVRGTRRPPGPLAVAAGTVSARATYQEVLFEGALQVWILPRGQREQEGEVHPDLTSLVVEPNVRLGSGPPHRSSLTVAHLGLRAILICRLGYASSLAAGVLLHQASIAATVVIGGFAAWQSGGLPRREVPAQRKAARWNLHVGPLQGSDLDGSRRRRPWISHSASA